MAKLLIRLVNNVAKLVNADKDVEGILTVLFVPDYSVSLGMCNRRQRRIHPQTEFAFISRDIDPCVRHL